MSTKKNKLIKKIRKQYGPLILIGLMMVSAGMSGWFVGHAYGLNHTSPDEHGNYTYNMSESEMQDQWVTETCIRLSINSPECDMVYGGVTDRVSDGIVK